jgi:hypothetical protein
MPTARWGDWPPETSYDDQYFRTAPRLEADDARGRWLRAA